MGVCDMSVDSGWYRATMQQYTSTDRDDYMLWTENGEVNVIVGQYPNTRFYIEYDEKASTLGSAYTLRNSSDTVNYTRDMMTLYGKAEIILVANG